MSACTVAPRSESAVGGRCTVTWNYIEQPLSLSRPGLAGLTHSLNGRPGPSCSGWCTLPQRQSLARWEGNLRDLEPWLPLRQRLVYSLACHSATEWPACHAAVRARVQVYLGSRTRWDHRDGGPSGARSEAHGDVVSPSHNLSQCGHLGGRRTLAGTRARASGSGATVT